MNIKDRMILTEYRKRKEDLYEVDRIVAAKIKEIVKNSHVLVTGVEHRVKTEESLEGKLFKSGESFQNLLDLYDLIGARIICYFNDGVNLIGEQIEKHFDIDYKKSSDKRLLLKADRFGYLSLHFIAKLKKEDGYPDNLTDIQFEIQIRTILQHAWAAVVHDLGYKNEFGVPKEVTREFARLAGLLELTDDEFIRIRDKIVNYTESTREKIINNDVENIGIDLISLREYMAKNQNMQSFLKKIADIEGSEICHVDPDTYIEQLNHLKITSLGDLKRMLELNEKLALQLATRSIAGTELDIITSNTALRYLTRAYLLKNGYSEKQIIKFFMISVKDEVRATREAKMLLNTFESIKNGK
jgi:ppGpp synthetase/RelA/SpoT-type nucleotidyltranferase